MTTYNQFPNVGYVQHDFTAKQLKMLHDEVNFIQEDFSKATIANYGLAGNIENEFKLSEKTRLYLEYMMMPLARAMYNSRPIYMQDTGNQNKMPALTLESTWVNFQKKYEFNPTHSHTGMYTFVIWLKVPYLIEDEKKFGPGRNSNHPVSGQFAFNYTDTNGSIINHGLEVDRTWENRAILFHSGLSHCVYPFYSSDEYRISVSGNFSIKAIASGQRR
jgi:hypothetical protein